MEIYNSDGVQMVIPSIDGVHGLIPSLLTNKVGMEFKKSFLPLKEFICSFHPHLLYIFYGGVQRVIPSNDGVHSLIPPFFTFVLGEYVMYVLDFGLTIVMYNSNDDTTQTLSREEFLKIPETLPVNSQLVSEYAHLGCPRKTRSRAQLFTAEELQAFYKSCEYHGIELGLFPQQLTGRARNHSQLPKNDSNDAKAIYLLLKDYPGIELMHPPENFDTSAKRQEAYDFKAVTNENLNLTRGLGKKGYLMDDDAISLFMRGNIEEVILGLSDNAKKVFGLTDTDRYKESKKNPFPKINFNTCAKISQIYSVITLLLDVDGNQRLRKCTGQLPGWKFVKRYAIGMTPFHLKGGVCRSNLYHHGIKNWVIMNLQRDLQTTRKVLQKKRRGGRRDADLKFVPGSQFTKKEDDLVLKYRRIYCKAIKELYVVCKKILENNAGVQLVIPSTDGVHPLIPA